VRTLAPAGKVLSCSRGASCSSSRVGIPLKKDIPERVEGSGLPGATLSPILYVLQGVSYGLLRRHGPPFLPRRRVQPEAGGGQVRLLEWTLHSQHRGIDVLRISSWRARAACILLASRSHILVEPSLSVNKKVTVPVGGLLTRSALLNSRPHYSIVMDLSEVEGIEFARVLTGPPKTASAASCAGSTKWPERKCVRISRRTPASLATLPASAAVK
jgi:hypothetical protein